MDDMELDFSVGLSSEEVWLSSYIALLNGMGTYEAADGADEALSLFKERFRNEN